MQLTPSVDRTGPRSDQKIQNNVSNLAFLEELARINGFYLWVEEDMLNFKRERAGEQTTVARGRDLISFSGRLSTAGHVSAIKVRCWSPSKDAVFSASAMAGEAAEYTARLSVTGQSQINRKGDGTTERVIYADGRIRSIDEAQVRAEAELLE